MILIQTALNRRTGPLGQFYHEWGCFFRYLRIAVVIGVLNNFFVSHCLVFRWRTAMNEHYMAHWRYLRHIRRGRQRVCRVPCVLPLHWREKWGVSFISKL